MYYGWIRNCSAQNSKITFLVNIINVALPDFYDF